MDKIARSPDGLTPNPGAAELVGRLVQEHHQAVLATALRATGDRQAAEEITQETFLRAWRHPQAFLSPDSSPRGWLLTVARRLGADRWRARARRHMAEAAAASEDAGGESDLDLVLEAEVLRQALARLSPEHREVLMECVWRERSVAEAAIALAVPEGTVKSRTYYALRSLRLILDEMGYRR